MLAPQTQTHHRAGHGRVGVAIAVETRVFLDPLLGARQAEHDVDAFRAVVVVMLFPDHERVALFGPVGRGAARLAPVRALRPAQGFAQARPALASGRALRSGLRLRLAPALALLFGCAAGRTIASGSTFRATSSA